MGRQADGHGAPGESPQAGARPGRRWARAGLAVAAVSLSATVAAGTLAPGTFAAAPVGRMARTVNVTESGHLHLTSGHGLKLNEQGTATGTIRGSIYIHLTISSPTRVTAEVNIYPSSGSLTGTSSASYSTKSTNPRFSGTLVITRGGGRYAHAHASALRFTGTIQHDTDAVTVQLSGPLSY
jgi:hypothetical protein